MGDINNLLEAYGAYCANCGNSDERVLQVHHVDGNGNKHRLRTGSSFKSRGSTNKYYLEIIQMATTHPGLIQLLCANCHVIADLNLNKKDM